MKLYKALNVISSILYFMRSLMGSQWRSRRTGIVHVTEAVWVINLIGIDRLRHFGFLGAWLGLCLVHRTERCYSSRSYLLWSNEWYKLFYVANVPEMEKSSTASFIDMHFEGHYRSNQHPGFLAEFTGQIIEISSSPIFIGWCSTFVSF